MAAENRVPSAEVSSSSSAPAPPAIGAGTRSSGGAGGRASKSKHIAPGNNRDMTESLTHATDLAPFRAQFPLLGRLAFLNPGAEGPIPRAAAEAAHLRIDVETDGGRCGRPYFDELMGLRDRARAGYAAVLGCTPSEVALTGSTTDGVNTVIGGLDLRPGEEILT